MIFDWPTFLERHGIEYATKGHGVTRDHIAIHCPMCGAADLGFHMSISTLGLGWRCWRHPEAHYGKSPIRLICMLIDCSWEHAANLCGHRATDLPTDLLSQVQRHINGEIASTATSCLNMPGEFKHLDNRKPSSSRYIKHLRRRGFSDQHIDLLAKPPFDLRYCTHGKFGGRVIFPVYHRGTLVSWTGRTIFANDIHNIRYKTFGSIGDHLLWFDLLCSTDADTIVLSEGPFDAAKITMLGLDMGIVGTCFFTATPSNRQNDLLHEVLPKFRKRILLLDRNTFTNATRLLWKEFVHVGVVQKNLPIETKDPGEIHNRKELLKILS